MIILKSTCQCPPWNKAWVKDLWDRCTSYDIWGTANYCDNSPASNIVMEHERTLASGMNIPKSLPYVLPWKNNESAP